MACAALLPPAPAPRAAGVVSKDTPGHAEETPPMAEAVGAELASAEAVIAFAE